MRDFNLRVLTEVLDNYDVDGIDVNLAQNPPFFNRAEPNKVEHMTAFIKALRTACDRVGKERGKHMLLTVILRDNLWGRDHLRDDGIDVASWVKAGLVDRIDVLGGSKSKYVAMVRGTKCKLYASVESRGMTHASFAKVEREFRDAGYDGVFVFNYMIAPGGRGEFRSMNVSYRPDVLPTVAPNVWEQSPGGSAELADDNLQLTGDACFRRGAQMTPMGGPGVTVEAQVQVLSVATPSICGIEIADGKRRATLGISADQLVLSEGDQKLNAVAVKIAPARAHTLRLTLDDKHVANAYLDGQNQPVMTATLRRPTTERFVRWGHLHAGGKAEPQSRWKSVRYTLDGALGPGESTLR